MKEKTAERQIYGQRILIAMKAIKNPRNCKTKSQQIEEAYHTTLQVETRDQNSTSVRNDHCDPFPTYLCLKPAEKLM